MKLNPWNWHFRADKIVAKFEAGEVSQTSKLMCLMFVTFLNLLAIELYFWMPNPNNTNIFDIVTSVVTVGTLLLGIMYAFSRHKSTSSFIEKYTVVAVAVIPVLVVYSIMYFVVLGLYYSINMVTTPETTWIDVLLTAMMSIVVNLKIGSYFN